MGKKAVLSGFAGGFLTLCIVLIVNKKSFENYEPAITILIITSATLSICIAIYLLILCIREPDNDKLLPNTFSSDNAPPQIYHVPKHFKKVGSIECPDALGKNKRCPVYKNPEDGRHYRHCETKKRHRK